MLAPQLTVAVPAIDGIWSWYEDQQAASELYRHRLHNALVQGQAVELKFADFSLEELEEYFDGHAVELEHLVCFALISAAEGNLQLDFTTRIERREKRGIGKRFKMLSRDVDRKSISVERHIVAAWKEAYPAREYKELFSAFVAVLKYRHWLAHGRHWEPTVGRRYDAAITYDVVKKMLDFVATPVVS